MKEYVKLILWAIAFVGLAEILCFTGQLVFCIPIAFVGKFMCDNLDIIINRK